MRIEFVRVKPQVQQAPRGLQELPTQAVVQTRSCRVDWAAAGTLDCL